MLSLPTLLTSPLLYVILPAIAEPLDETLTPPQQVDWVTGDTTDSIKYITNGEADIAITYNAQAEYRALNLSSATRREYGFRDHFYLLGPA